MVNYRYCIVCRVTQENATINSSTKTLFKFPNSPTRRENWIKILQVPKEAVKGGARVCDLHFKKSQFVRTTLKPNAIPSLVLGRSPEPVTPSGHHDVACIPLCPIYILRSVTRTPVSIAPKPRVLDMNMMEPSPANQAKRKDDRKMAKEDFVKRLDQIKLARLRKRAIVDKRRIRRLKERVVKMKLKLKQRVDIKEVFEGNMPFRSLIEAQVARYKSKIRPYSDSERVGALSLYYACGSNGYETLRKMGFALPEQSTLLRWTRSFQMNTGINARLLSCIQNIVSGFTDRDKDCLITWDEMSIKELVEYNKYRDMFEGLQDFGSHGRALDSANEVLVFMIRGINSNWRFPISYYFSKHATTSEMLDILVTENITSVQNIGLKVRIGICDMSFTNQGLYRAWSITKATPFRTINNCKIYFIHDTPHLIKLVRNNLIRHNFIIHEQNGNNIINRRVRWSHISTFYTKDRRVASRMAPKLCHSHIYLKDFSKMKVKLATQVLSRSVYAGIMTMCRLKILKKEFIDTAVFVKKMDELFDFLNMSLLTSDKWGRCAVHFYSNLSKLDDFAKYCESITIPTMNREPDFLRGLQINLAGIKMLAIDLLQEGYTYLFTRNLQQDCLENYFSLVRSKGGCCKNPTAKSFRNIFRVLFFTTLIHTPKSSNTEQIKGFEKYAENMEIFIKTNRDLDMRPVSRCPPYNFDAPLDSCEAALFYSVKLCRRLKLGKEQEEEVSAYLGAACIYAEIKRTNCNSCKQMLVTRDEIGQSKHNKYTLIDFKQFDEVVDHLSYLRREEGILFQSMNALFQQMACKSLNSCGEKVHEGISKLYKENEAVINWLSVECTEHRESILGYFIRAKLFRLVKDKNMSIRQLKSFGQTRRDMRNQ